jgi:hypothetical protein
LGRDGLIGHFKTWQVSDTKLGAYNMADNVERPSSDSQKRVPCEVYSRIVGYLRPVQDWNEGKQQEFAERKTYALAETEQPSPETPARAPASKDREQG